ncbi:MULTISPECIES: hypothetical protein [unclassified Allomuricauda]|uniref:hypothetical protein n=2 Tax=Allomuricauda TaxID=111500 RepID=UPI00273DEB40|nr:MULTISPECIES: hypothetical protein [unclassified Allomuricauda]
MKIKFLKLLEKLLALFFLVSVTACSQESKKSNLSILSNQIPVDTALVFGPGIISTKESHESAIAFNQDMTELYLNRRKPNGTYKIYVMNFVDGQWSKAALASFYTDKDKNYADYRPRLNPQGDILYFSSDRPLIGETKSTGGHQWYVKKSENGWGQPMPFDIPAADGVIVDVASSRNGNLYFSLNKKDGKPEDENVYYSVNKNGENSVAEEMGDDINSPGVWSCCPFIAPDESYMIYDSPRESGYGWVDLYISFKKNGRWTKSYNLGPTVNTNYGEGLATVSPDGKFLFFYRDLDGTGDIFWTDFEKLKKEIQERIAEE